MLEGWTTKSMYKALLKARQAEYERNESVSVFLLDSVKLSKMWSLTLLYTKHLSEYCAAVKLSSTVLPIL